jgi:hypothetical protein
MEKHMKKITTWTLSVFFIIFIFLTNSSSEFKSDIFEKIRPTEKDMPAGYIYGKIPRIYQSILKDNPWIMDARAVKKLADKIYPGGDSGKIAGIHMSIIANEKKPYNDDIVCYIIVFRDKNSARSELRKLNDFAGYNSDRVILIMRDSMAVLMFVDNTGNMGLLREMAGIIEVRLQGV